MTLTKLTQKNYPKQTSGVSDSPVKIFLSQENKKALKEIAPRYSLPLQENFMNSKTKRNLPNIRDSKSFGGNQQVGRVYGTDGIAPTLNTMQGGGRDPKILDDQGRTKKRLKPLSISPTLRSQSHGNEPKVAVREATKIGYDVAKLGDSINFAQPNSKTRHAPKTWDKELRIRKLTPRETWRLQGFPDWAFDRAEKVNSNSQLYKQAGNSVTVPVIYEIAKRMNWEEIENDR